MNKLLILSNDNFMALPENFYQQDKWLSSLLTFYSNKDSMPSRDVLENPLYDITDNIQTMCLCYANFPQDLINFLEVISNPLINDERFTNDIINKIRLGYEETGEEGYIEMAESLQFLRGIFKKDDKLVRIKYSKIIEENNILLEHFINSISTMVRTHTIQVVKEIQKATS